MNYAYYCKEGPLLAVANLLVTGFNKAVTVPFVTNLDFKVTRKNVMEKVRNKKNFLNGLNFTILYMSNNNFYKLL